MKTPTAHDRLTHYFNEGEQMLYYKRKTQSKIYEAVSLLVDILDKGQITEEQFNDINKMAYKLNTIADEVEGV